MRNVEVLRARVRADMLDMIICRGGARSEASVERNGLAPVCPRPRPRRRGRQWGRVRSGTRAHHASHALDREQEDQPQEGQGDQTFTLHLDKTSTYSSL